MKIKQTAWISNAIEFLSDNSMNGLDITDPSLDMEVHDWIKVADIEIDADLCVEDIRALAAKAIDQESEKVKTEMLAKLELLKMKKAELLCIGHD